MPTSFQMHMRKELGLRSKGTISASNQMHMCMELGLRSKGTMPTWFQMHMRMELGLPSKGPRVQGYYIRFEPNAYAYGTWLAVQGSKGTMPTSFQMHMRMELGLRSKGPRVLYPLPTKCICVWNLACSPTVQGYYAHFVPNAYAYGTWLAVQGYYIRFEPNAYVYGTWLAVQGYYLRFEPNAYAYGTWLGVQGSKDTMPTSFQMHMCIELSLRICINVDSPSFEIQKSLLSEILRTKIENQMIKCILT